MISQEQLNEILNLVDQLFWETQEDDVEKRCLDMLCVLQQEIDDTAPSNIFWNYMSMWTSDGEFSDTLIAEFDNEINGEWLDHLAIEREERWDDDWSTCLSETVNIISQAHPELADKLEAEIAELDN